MSDIVQPSRQAPELSLRGKFERDGYVGPFRAISEAQAATLAETVMAALKEDAFSAIARRNRHFDLPAVHDVAVSPVIADVLTEIYSPEITLWRSHVFTGKPGRGLGWHSDYFRTILDNPLDHLTLHFAITEAPVGNCLMVLPGSHKWSQAERDERGFHLIGKTMDRGYGTPYYVRDEGDCPIVTMALKPGEFFVFDPGLLHASVDRVGDTSNKVSVLGQAKAFAKRFESQLARFGLVQDPSRLAIGLRYCDPRNGISAKAFEETLDKGHGPVTLAGTSLPDGFIDWRGDVQDQRSALADG